MVETFVARVIADGRITIPESIREVLAIKEGDLVRTTVEKANKVEGV